MINPSDINLKKLPWVPLRATNGFPEDAAIYFAIDSRGRVQYIGRSINVRGRWKNHHRYSDLESIGGVKVAYLFVDAPELLPEIESALIEWFSPPLNFVRKKPASTRRTLNLGDDLYLKLRKVAYRERLNATQQLERALDKFFADYEKQNKLKIDEIEIPGEDGND